MSAMTTPFWLGLMGLAMTGWLLQSAIRSYAAANASPHWSRSHKPHSDVVLALVAAAAVANAGYTSTIG